MLMIVDDPGMDSRKIQIFLCLSRPSCRRTRCPCRPGWRSCMFCC